jgi:hypothetical protein
MRLINYKPYTTYLAEAQANLPEDPYLDAARPPSAKEYLDSIRRFGKGTADLELQAVLRELTSLKQDYIAVYSELHRKTVLTASGDDLPPAFIPGCAI